VNGGSTLSAPNGGPSNEHDRSITNQRRRLPSTPPPRARRPGRRVKRRSLQVAALGGLFGSWTADWQFNRLMLRSQLRPRRPRDTGSGQPHFVAARSPGGDLIAAHPVPGMCVCRDPGDARAGDDLLRARRLALAASLTWGAWRLVSARSFRPSQRGTQHDPLAVHGSVVIYGVASRSPLWRGAAESDVPARSAGCRFAWA